MPKWGGPPKARVQCTISIDDYEWMRRKGHNFSGILSTAIFQLRERDRNLELTPEEVKEIVLAVQNKTKAETQSGTIEKLDAFTFTDWESHHPEFAERPVAERWAEYQKSKVVRNLTTNEKPGEPDKLTPTAS